MKHQHMVKSKKMLNHSTLFYNSRSEIFGVLETNIKPVSLTYSKRLHLKLSQQRRSRSDTPKNSPRKREEDSRHRGDNVNVNMKVECLRKSFHSIMGGLKTNLVHHQAIIKAEGTNLSISFPIGWHVYFWVTQGGTYFFLKNPQQTR